MHRQTNLKLPPRTYNDDGSATLTMLPLQAIPGLDQRASVAPSARGHA